MLANNQHAYDGKPWVISLNFKKQYSLRLPVGAEAGETKQLRSRFGNAFRTSNDGAGNRVDGSGFSSDQAAWRSDSSFHAPRHELTSWNATPDTFRHLV